MKPVSSSTPSSAKFPLKNDPLLLRSLVSMVGLYSAPLKCQKYSWSSPFGEWGTEYGLFFLPRLLGIGISLVLQRNGTNRKQI